MHWNTEPFIETHELIQEIFLQTTEDDLGSLNSLYSSVGRIMEDFKNLLKTPKRSEASRDKIRNGKLSVDDEEFSLNQEFVETAIMVSEELGIDEVVAAQLVLYSSGDLNRLDMTPLQAGIALFYVRRQYILDLIRFFLSQSVVGDRSGLEFKRIVKDWVGGDDVEKKAAVLSNVLDAMKEVENDFLELNEKEKRGQFLGQIHNSDFVQLLKLRRDFLLREHDCLGQILYGMVSNRLINEGVGIGKLIDRVKGLAEYDTMFIHYLPSLLLYFSSFDPLLSGTDYCVELDEAYKAYNLVVGGSGGTDEWKLDYVKGALSLAMLSGFTGCCRNESTEVKNKIASHKINYQTSILDPTKVAIDLGAIEFFMILASNISKSLDKKPHFYDYRQALQSRVPSLKKLGELSDEFLQLLLQELERMVELLITNLADVFKDMRLNEEDYFLALDNDSYQDDPEVPENDLERLFVFISYLYSDRENASLKFWVDSESSLYGFITWALECKILFMSTTLCDMLASLSYGEECSKAVYELLKDEDGRGGSGGGSGGSSSGSGSNIANNRDAITFGTSTSSKDLIIVTSNHYKKLTWNAIFNAFTHFANTLKPKSNPSNSLSFSTTTNALVSVSDMQHLDDDIILLLSSYFRLITVVVDNNKDASYKFATDGKGGYIGSLFDLLRCQTPLYGTILTALSSFAQTNNEKLRYALWNSVDNLIFHTIVYRPDGTVIAKNLSPKERFTQLFRSPGEIIGVITLIQSLIKPLEETTITQSFPFPQDLGGKYRYPGIWCYIDFIINEVFASSVASEFNTDDRLFLQLPCLEIIKYSLEMLDPDLTRLSANLGVNPDLIVRSQSFLNYLYNHPCSTTMSYLFSRKIYNILISICSINIDEINELDDNDPLIKSVILAITIINDILDNQQIFLDVIVREFKHSVNITTTPANNAPFQIVNHGLKAFEDVLLHKLPIVTYLALYIGSPNIELASRSLQLLERISLSSQFLSTITTDARVKKNRLLSILETVDESIRIKKGFLDQLERPLEKYNGNPSNIQAIEIKLLLLRFLIANLKNESNEPTTAHFLLGFRTTGDGQLTLDDDNCGIATGISSFNTIVNLLQYGIENINNKNVEYRFSKLSNYCIEIILLLVENPLTSQSILTLLRDGEFDFILSLLKKEPIINPTTLWNNKPFTSSDNSTISTIESFFNHRSALLEYISLEIFESSQLGSLSLVEKYLDLLINLDLNKNFTKKKTATINTPNTAIMLSFLDVLEMPVTSNQPLDQNSITFFSANSLQQMFEIIDKEVDNEDESIISELSHLLKLRGLELISTGKISSLDDDIFKSAFSNVVNFIHTTKSNNRIRKSQLNCLKSWSKLALVLIYDTNIPPSKQTTFVLETLQTLIPKLVDYSNSDIEFAEILASLLESLQTVYQQNLTNSSNNTAGYDRSHSLFKTSLESIQSPLVTPELRTDLYIICYQYLKSTLDSSLSSLQIIEIIRSSGDKLLSIVSNDALFAEGVTRLVALIFLEVLFSLSSKTNSTFVQDGLVRYNLLLLLVKSIQRIDQEITTNRDNLTPSELFFEFKVFNATLCFLLQVARTKSGADQLIQSGIFDVLDSCQFLNIDLDVGIEISSSDNFKLSFYDIIVPVFQTVCAIVLSLGPENERVINRTKTFIERHQQSIVAIMKKDMLQSSSIQDPRLDELVKLTVLLISFTDYVPNI